MKNYDIVIVGGGPAGVQAALSARNTSPAKSIVLIRKEKVALIPCGIPYILHSLNSVDDDIMPDGILQKNDIDLMLGEVVNRDAKVVHLRDGQQIEFEKLVLAAGSFPIKPSIPGIDNKNIFILSKDYKNLIEMRNAVKSSKRVLIVGGGYVGVELADELSKENKSVVIVELLPFLLPTSVDPEFSEVIKGELEKQEVKVITGCGVKTFSQDGPFISTELENTKKIETDLVIVSVGFRPNISLAEKFGLKVDNKFGVIVDEYLKTSDNDIFAVGDCAAKRSCYTGDYRQIMLASTAMSQGRLAGSNLFSIHVVKTFTGTLGSFATKIGDVALGVTGLTEIRAKKMGLEYVVGVAESVDRHPGKLQGAKKMTVKLIYAKYSHLLLGAQVLGGDSVGECVNMLSVMIQKKMIDIEVDTLQIGTHPLLTPSPLAYTVINATVNAIMKWYH